MTPLLIALLLAQDWSEEAVQSVRKLRVPAGLKVELFAAEPQFVNPVSLAIDEKGRVYVAETHRRHGSTLEVWERRDWLDGDLAARTVEDRVALYRKQLGAAADKLAVDSERIRVIEGSDAKTFAEGFNTLADGLGSSVLVRGNEVWYTCAPNLWHLGVGADGKASARKVLHYGFGVHMGSGAHDLHGLCFGPDGKLYFSMGDRGFHVEAGGKTFDSPDTGAVLRCNPDGSQLEVFATGLRNPEQLCFDANGNLWTGDNNSDAGDKARWVWVVEGGDYGWRFGYQREVLKSPWMIEKLWTTDAAPSQVPPAGYVGHGPSGVAFNPGTALDAAHANRFFMCDFPGSVRSFAVKPKGAGFEVVDDQQFLGELWPTDCKFGPDGALYVSDWVQGWAKPEKGRIFRVFDPRNAADTGKLLAAGMSGREIGELHDLLSHPDYRVRLAAQFELVAMRKGSVLAAVAQSGIGLERLHAVWGLGQMGLPDPLRPLLQDPDPEVRAQAAKVLGDLRAPCDLLPLLKDASPRVRFHAALAAAKCRNVPLATTLLDILQDGGDPWLLHAAAVALSDLLPEQLVLVLKNYSPERAPASRMAALVALRRMQSPELRKFLRDRDPAIVLEAARAIHDVPIDAAMDDLAELLKDRRLPERVAVRAINAAFRTARADLLIPYMLDPDAPEALRIQTIDSVADWVWPNGRDRVMGLWRPLLPRPMPDDLGGVFQKLIADAQPAEVRVHALKGWGELELPAAAEVGAVFSSAAPSAVRVEALRTLAKTKDAGAKAAITGAVDDKDAAVREEAVKLLVRLKLPDTAPLLEKLAGRGPLAVRQAAVASLGDLTDADAALARLLDGWKDQPAGLQLELLEAAGKRTAVEVQQRLGTVDKGRTPNAELLEGGDAKAGKDIFFERLDVACARCHTIRDKGGVVGPPLTKVGAERTREQILESILFPNKVIVQGYGQVMLALKSDAVEVGRVEKETATELHLVMGDGSRKTILKSEIRARKEGLSAMPDDVSKPLSRRDLRDLVAYLATCQK